MMDVQADDPTANKSEQEPGKINEERRPVLPDTPQGSKEVIEKHSTKFI
jgi:hypothetical protein